MDSLTALLGEASSIVTLREQIGQILGRTSRHRRIPPILLQGETGTGKNLVAHLIHRAGSRAAGPFVEVNCAAIPEGLLEAELFGFERGAFTDARQPKVGLLQAANGGTILLDEIGLLTDALQAKLLTVVEERTVRRLGATRNEPIDVCIIAATNEDLEAAVAARRFRQDLYHRLVVLTLRLPPLRERRDDIPLLADHFLARACSDYGLPAKIITPAARQTLCTYPWPGNVRELANVMERVALLTDTLRILPKTLALPTGSLVSDQPTPMTAPPNTSLGARVESLERQELLRALEETRGDVTRAARRLGITRGTIRYRLAKYGLDSPRKRVRRQPPVTPSPQPAGGLATTPPTVTRWEHRLVALLLAMVRPLDTAMSPAEFGRDFDLLAQKVESFAGRIEEAGSVRIVAAFGIEPAEDAPRRAALAAMAMQNALQPNDRSQARRVVVITVVHAEQCPVGEVGGRLQLDADAKRRMTLVLEQLGAQSEADAVVVTSAVRSLLGPRFEFEDSEESAPPSSRLLAYHQHRFGVGGGPGPFVGRQHELDALRARWTEALAGRGQAVAVVGEPGIGKSRLLFEFRRTIGDEPFTYLEGRAESYGQGIGYLPVTALLKGWFHVDERDAPSTTASNVSAQLLALDEGLVSDLAPLLALLGAPATHPEWAALAPHERRLRTLDALRRLVVRMAHAQPLLLVVEDLHWIDAESQAFLDRLVVSLPATRMMVVVSYRPEYRHDGGPQTAFTQLRLDPLPMTSAEELLRGLVGDDAALRPLTRLLIERTGGNPFFLEESIRTLIETRGLVAEHPRTLQVPPTVHAVLAARIDRLPPEEKHVLQAAAVIGNDVPLVLLQKITDAFAGGLSRALLNLEAAEFIQETRLLPDVEYTFKHALTHEVAYGSLHPERRLALHARIVEAIEAMFPDRLTEHAERLAHHAFRGEAWEQAARYGRQAGLKALARFASREATAYFEQSVEALRKLPEDRSTRELAIDLRLDLYNSLAPLNELQPILDYLREAEAMARALRDRHRLSWTQLHICHLLLLIGEAAEAVQLGREVVALAEADGDGTIRAVAELWVGCGYYVLGELRRAVESTGRSQITAADRALRRPFDQSAIPAVWVPAWARGYQSMFLGELGEFDRGTSVGAEALRIVEGLQFANAIVGNSHWMVAGVHIARGELDRAIALLERAVAVGREWGRVRYATVAAYALGYVKALAGRTTEGLALIQDAVRELDLIAYTWLRSQRLNYLGEAYLLAGRLDEARTIADQALEFARQRRERTFEAWSLRLLAEIDARDEVGDLESSERRYLEAKTLAAELGMRPLVAHCHAGLARLHRRTGERVEVDGHFATATAMYREMGMTYWLKKHEQR